MKIKVKITTNENMEFLNVKKDTVVEVEFEEYLKAVVASEVGNAHLEVCKAQAVAARSFAISRGVLKGKEISDSSATAQAYRAKRNSSTFSKCIKGVEQTKGEVLMYGDTIINAIYTASNGGRTVSALEKWGSPYPFLIAQDDPWDKAAGYKLNGTGVGMSQRGAMYAAKQGIGYKEILAFYYPFTYLEQNYGETKARRVVQIAKDSLGHPYVFAALGEACTPANRRKYQRSDYPGIVDNCQVLSKKKSNCEGCKYAGGRIYDCRGFTWYCLKQEGVTISSVGATTQYNTSGSWVKRGLIKNGMPNVVCCVFKKKGDKMSHTGLHIGDGLIIHCSGEVKYSGIEDTTWTHYAIPKGLHPDAYLAAAQDVKVIKTLSKGSKGEAVAKLQSMLNELGFNCGEADGSYGTKTMEAVKEFQRAYGLLIDGIYGKNTAAMMDQVYEKFQADKKKKKDSDTGTGTNPDDTGGDTMTTEEKIAELEKTLASLQKSLKTLTTKVNKFKTELENLKK